MMPNLFAAGLVMVQITDTMVDSTSAMLGFWQARRRGQPRGFEHQVLFVSRRPRWMEGKVEGGGQDQKGQSER